MGFWLVVIASIVLLFLWGLLSPRGQWNVLSAWSRRNPRAEEPSSFVFGIRRLISALGVLFFAGVGLAGVNDYLASIPPEPPEFTALQQMWGVAPVPLVVDRVIGANSVVPRGLVERPVSAYQVVDNAEGTPRYLHLLEHFTVPGDDLDASGMVGPPPGRRFSALDSAELVVNVRAWNECIPRYVVLTESETAVQVAVYYGLPNRADGEIPRHADCTRPPFVQKSALLPLNLSEPLGERELQSLDGTPIREVAPIEE